MPARGSIAPSRDPGLYEIWVSLREGSRAEEALEVVEAQLTAVRAEGVTEAPVAPVEAGVGTVEGQEG